MKKKLLTMLLVMAMVASSTAVAFGEDMINVGTLYITRSGETATDSAAAAAAASTTSSAASTTAAAATTATATTTSSATAATAAEGTTFGANQDLSEAVNAMASDPLMQGYVLPQRLVKTKPVLTKVKSVRYDRLKLTWEKIDSVDGYKVYRATSKSGKYKLVKTVSGDSTLTYTDTKRTCGKTYYYKIKAYKKSGGVMYYTKYSAVMSGKSVPSKTSVTDAWDAASGTDTYVQWKAVAGATDYQIQYRYTLEGKTTKWQSKVGPDIEGNTYKFYTYNAMVKDIKKEYPSGKATVVRPGYHPESPIETITVSEYIDRQQLKKNQAKISELTRSKFVVVWDDETTKELEPFLDAGGKLDVPEKTFEFRVRAYKTVNGKKVYGAWSDPYTLVETFDIQKAYDELRAYAIKYANENYPEWKYDDFLASYVDDVKGSYYVNGDFMANVGKYVKTEDFIERFKVYIENYIRYCVNAGGHLDGCLYIKRVVPGDTEGMKGATRNETSNTRYKIWMFYGG